MERIPVAGPWITQKEIDYVNDAVSGGWYANASNYINKFEAAFASYTGVKYAVAMPSCTAAIHIALLTLNINAGDEVIVPDITWIATAAPINYVGAVPVFVDIDKKTWCISPEAFEAAITPKTKAVIIVDLYGNVCDMDKIKEIARKNGIKIIEDAAQAVGAEYKGRRAGSFGDAGVFSFHGTKTLTTGEGGMFLTDSDEIYQRCIFLRDHGRNTQSGKMFWNDEVAYKYKMSNMQAALGLAQLERIDELIKRKIEIFEMYAELLSSYNMITLNYQAAGTRSAYWMVTAVLNKKIGLTKEDIIKNMSSQNIDCRPFFYPLSSMPAYEGVPGIEKARANNTVSYELSPYAVNLPGALTLTKEKIACVCDSLIKMCNF